jgi:hypothetical protein
MSLKGRDAIPDNQLGHWYACNDTTAPDTQMIQNGTGGHPGNRRTFGTI